MNLRSTYPGLPDPPPAGQPMLPPGTHAGRTILITGGGTDLGKAMAVEFARLGGNIVIVIVIDGAERHRRALRQGEVVPVRLQIARREAT